MLIVSKGKVVLGHKIIGLGGELDGLTPETEEQFIAAGIAKRVGDDDVFRTVDDDEDVRNVPGAVKELTKAELQDRCRELGISAHGTKSELQARIAEFERDSNEELEELDEADEDGEEPPDLTAEVPQ